MNKTVTIDSYKYEVTASHEPNVLFPFRYKITITHSGEVIKSETFNNLGNFTPVELVKNVVKEAHFNLINRLKRTEAQKKFEKEFKEWDGVIEND